MIEGRRLRQAVWLSYLAGKGSTYMSSICQLPWLSFGLIANVSFAGILPREGEPFQNPSNEGTTRRRRRGLPVSSSG